MVSLLVGSCDTNKDLSEKRALEHVPEKSTFYFLTLDKIDCKAQACNLGNRQHLLTYTDGNNILDTPLVKHYNDLLERQSSERGKDEVSYFYARDVFLYTPWD